VPREKTELLAFNRGLISRLALARQDLKRMAFSAETMTNWMPRTLGSMMLRPGLGYLGSTASNAAARFLPFIFRTDDTALLEFTSGAMRGWIDDSVLTRGSVSSTVANGNFDSNLTSWTDSDEAGGTSVWVAGGYMGLTGNGTAAAIRDQQVTVAAADQGDEHALRIVIERGPVTLRVGSTSGDDDYIAETTLRTGTHSLALTPAGNFHIRFMSRLKRQVLVDSCNVEASGVVSITSPYLAADLGKIRGGPDSQSGDVVFLACEGYQQRRIERRSTRSWSLVLYQTEDGPFRPENLGPTTITPSALSGNITLTASADLFNEDQVGALFRITSNGQQVADSAITAQNTFTGAIRVTGVDAQRVFTSAITGLSGTGSTVTIQRSLESEDGPWTDYANFTSDSTRTEDDGLDNQIAWYRIGVKTGNYAGGTISVSLSYTVGSINGVVRITDFTSATSVSAEVLSDLGGTAATDVWAEGQWSDYRGWPTSVAFYEGRLGWAGKDGVQLSVSDAFESFDEDTEGDSGPINRTIGSGPVDVINFLLPLQRLILGGQGAEYSARSTAFDEPLTPSNFNLKPASTQGSAGVPAIKIDSRGAFVQRGGTRLFELVFDPNKYDYDSSDMTKLIPEIGQPSISRVAVQRQPDTRIHCVRSDGKAAVLVHDETENVLCWLLLETDGEIEDVVILPGEDGDEEDRVYYVAKRTINGATVRYLEKWAQESECVGETLNKQADAFVTYSQSASSTISGLSHLIGESVVVWDNGKCLRDTDDEIATFTVSASGTITVTNDGSAYQATTGVVGLAYEAPYKTAKLGRNLGLDGRVDSIALLLADTHMRGLRFGCSLDDDDLDYLPLMKDEAPVAEDTVYESYDQPFTAFPSKWSTNPRVCLKAAAPRPCTVLGAVAIGEFYG
jgi:hypothetical protein